MKKQLTLCIDAGHGSDTRKNTGGKYSPITDMDEYEFNKAVAKHLMLLCDNLGIKYINVSPEDTDTPLQVRTMRANNFYRQHKDTMCVYVSLHANAGGGTGTEIWAIHNATKETKALVGAVLESICTKTGQRNRGVKLGYVTNPGADFHVNRETDMVSMLIEYGFMDSKDDCYKLLDDKFRQQCAEATLQGICKHYGIRLLPKPDPPKPEDTTNYKKLFEKEKARTAYLQGQIAAIKTIVEQ